MVLPWMAEGSILNYMDKIRQAGKLTPDNHDAVTNQWASPRALVSLCVSQD